MNRRAALLLLGFAALLAGCGRQHADAADVATTRLVVTGSSTCAPLVNEIARRYEEQAGAFRIDVQTGGSSRGIADVAAGLAHIGMSSRSLTPRERSGRREHLFARDGVCFIVHASNTVPPPTDAQLRAVFTGAITNWSQLGGRDAPITVIGRADGRSELELVGAYLGIDRPAFALDAIAGENQQGIKQVAGDPNAITYMSVGTSAREAAAGTPIRLLPLGGVTAGTETIGDASYPLSRPLLLVTPAETIPDVRAFIDFARSDAVHDLVLDHAFIPVAR